MDRTLRSRLDRYILANKFENTTAAKQVFIFLGMPGTGKTVLLRRIGRFLNTRRWHIGDFTNAAGPLSEKNEQASREGGFLEGSDEPFLASIARSPDPIVLLDGFPRKLEQAEKLLCCALYFNWKLTLVHLAFPLGREVEYSLARQDVRTASMLKKSAASVQHSSDSRTPQQLREEEEARSRKKIFRAIEFDMYVIATLRDAGLEYLELDATRGTGRLYKQLVELLETGFSSGKQPGVSLRGNKDTQ